MERPIRLQTYNPAIIIKYGILGRTLVKVRVAIFAILRSIWVKATSYHRL